MEVTKGHMKTYPVTGVCIYIHVYTSVCGNYNAAQFGTRSMQRRQSRARGRVAGRRYAMSIREPPTHLTRMQNSAVGESVKVLYMRMNVQCDILVGNLGRSLGLWGYIRLCSKTT